MIRKGIVLVNLLFLVSCQITEHGTIPQPKQGLKLLNPDAAKSSVAFVFIHGIFGESLGTWRNKESSESWPELVVGDENFQNSAVYVAHYDSPKFSESSNIREIATRLGHQLSRKDIYDHESIIFVTHSMGGLVAKQILSDLHTPERSRDLENVISVFLISVPSAGAKIADLASWISKNPQLKNMSASSLNTYLQSLERDWAQIFRERENSRKLFPKSLCAYETKDTGPIRIVERLYAKTTCDEEPYPVDKNHHSIVKPLDRTDDVYDWFSELAQDFIQLNHSVIRPISPSDQVSYKNDGDRKSQRRIRDQEATLETEPNPKKRTDLKHRRKFTEDCKTINKELQRIWFNLAPEYLDSELGYKAAHSGSGLVVREEPARCVQKFVMYNEYYPEKPRQEFTIQTFSKNLEYELDFEGSNIGRLSLEGEFDWTQFKKIIEPVLIEQMRLYTR